MRQFIAPALLALLAATSPAAERMTPELLWDLGRVSGGSVSSDGKRVAYMVQHFDLAEDAGTTAIHVVTLDGRQDNLVVGDLKSASSLQWGRGASDGRLFYIAASTPTEDSDDKAEPEAKPQVWSVDPDGGEPRQLTNIEQGVANLKVAPAGTHIAFTVDVKMDPTVNEIFQDLPKADARIIDSLMYRHWDSWHDYAYSHVHVARFDDGGAGEPSDLMKGLSADCPLPPFGGAEQFAWSPDGREIAFTAKIVNNPAESTDSDIYLVDVGGGHARSITAGRNGYDTNPAYSPDGRYIAFQSMKRAGFEADRNRIMLYDRSSGDVRELSVGLDQTTQGATWLPDSRSLLFVSEWRGTDQIFQIWLDGGKTTQISRGWYNWALADVFPQGRTALVTRQSMVRPVELATLSVADGQCDSVTGVNDERFANVELPHVEERWVRASDGKMIHSWVIYPPDFDPAKKWPMLTYCQGGPQGQIGQWFSYRWNFHLMAARGYVVLAVNRRGLPGFGRQWNDQISRDWGGQAMQDILAATDDMMAEPYIDARRVAAVGASFGGYTVYWLMGHHEDRFCCMIAHCGVFDLESWYGSTEELFFANWDLGGPYWQSKQLQRDYDRFSPHRFVRNWKTPLLVIHGEKDFRVPVTQAMEAFTAAKVKGIPSRFLYFPSEGHWVLKPQNGVLWHRVFFDWLGRYCRE